MSTRSKLRTSRTASQEWLDHIDRAQAQKLSLAQYCRNQNLNAQRLYNARYELSKRAPRSKAKVRQLQSAGKFIEVQLAAEPAVGSMACRVRVLGGVIECATLPSASWLRSLMSGGGDAVS